MKIYEVATTDRSYYRTNLRDAIRFYSNLVDDDEYAEPPKEHDVIELIERLVKENDIVRNKLIAATLLLSDRDAEPFLKWLNEN